VLLVQACLGEKNEFVTYPLGLAYVGSALARQGHEVRLYDPNVTDTPYEGLAHALREQQPEVVGVSLRNIDNQDRLHPVYYYLHFRATLAAIRRDRPAVPLIVGGPGFSMFAHTVMERNPEIDFGVYLEGEEAFPELLTRLSSPSSVKGIFHRHDGQVLFTGARPFPDFSTLPFPRRDFLDLAPYRQHAFSMGVQTKRGCPLNCAYCNYPHLNGRTCRSRSVESVMGELEYLAADLGIRTLTFADSVFNVPKDFAVRIMEEMALRKLDLRWSAYLHLRGVDAGFLRLAMASGCHDVLFSPDGYSRPALKGLQKNIAQEDIHRSMQVFLSDRVFDALIAGYCFFVSPPGETLRGFLETLWFFVRMRLRPRMRRFIIIRAWIRVEPETAVHRIAIERGIMDRRFDLLPETQGGVRKTFFVEPAVAGFDAVFAGVMGVLRRLKGALAGRHTAR
jgi:hypothetical protein